VNSWPGSTQTAQVVVQEIGGSNTIPLLSGKGFWGLRWSPDGAELLVSGLEVEGGPGTFLVPRLGGTPRRFAYSQYLAWSPDGSRFAGFDRRSLTVTDKRTGETKPVPVLGLPEEAPAPAPPVGIDWSPSGDWLVYFTYEGQSVVLWTVSAAGGEPTRIVEDTVRIASPRCAPEGDFVYYLRWPGKVAELWKAPVSARTGRPRGSPRLVMAGVEAVHDFSISGDGKRLLHTWRTSYSNLQLAPLEGVERRPRGDDARPVTTGTSTDTDPAVSPDGTRVAFTRDSDQGSHVFVVPITGGTPQQISYGGTDNHFPVWSPDGREIAFVSGEGDEQSTHHVFRAAAMGGTPERLAGARPGSPPWLAWGPGSRILYLPPDRRNITSLDPATGEERPLLREDWGGRISAAWYSPDGTGLAIEWFQPDDPQAGASVSVVSFADGRSTLVTENAPGIFGWSRGGRGLLGFEDTAAGGSIVALPLTGGRPRLLRTLPPGQSLGGAVTPDGRAVVCVVGTVLSDVWLIENFDSDVR
jgi:dipeptidyl aminopeptidase/acylaminoacyl peptidase